MEAVKWVSWPWFPASLAHLDTHHASVWKGYEVPEWDSRHLKRAALMLVFPPRKMEGILGTGSGPGWKWGVLPGVGIHTLLSGGFLCMPLC